MVESDFGKSSDHLQARSPGDASLVGISIQNGSGASHQCGGLTLLIQVAAND
jgi:hypothetical protein